MTLAWYSQQTITEISARRIRQFFIIERAPAYGGGTSCFNENSTTDGDVHSFYKIKTYQYQKACFYLSFSLKNPVKPRR